MEQVKLTVSELRALYMALSQIAQRELPFKAAYAVARTRRALQDEWDAVEDTRTKLLQLEDQQQAEEEWRKLLKTEVEVRVMRFPAELLGDRIEPVVLDGLMPMLLEQELQQEEEKAEAS